MKTICKIAFLFINMLAAGAFSAKDDPVGDVLDDVTLDRKEATEFKPKYRRWSIWPNIKEECYHECCSREEVDEHFPSWKADRYWKAYQKWTKTPASHC